jgi:hypothetical protein
MPLATLVLRLVNVLFLNLLRQLLAGSAMLLKLLLRMQFRRAFCRASKHRLFGRKVVDGAIHGTVGAYSIDKTSAASLAE